MQLSLEILLKLWDGPHHDIYSCDHKCVRNDCM